MEQAAADLVLLQHHGHRLGLIQRGLPGAAALRVGRECALELMGEPEVVDDEAARLVPEHPVDARDRLHQPVPAHRLVDVHRVQAGRIEAGEPHVAYQHHLKRVGRAAEPFGQRLPAGLVADVRLPVERIGGGARHDHLEPSVVVILVMPLGPQARELAIEVDADAPAHADDHRLAIHGFEALVEVNDDVPGDEFHALLRPDDRFELRPPGFELLLAVDLLALGRFLEARVDLRPLALVERQLGEPALVVDRHRRLVLDRALDVVDADVIPEHGAGVGVLKLDRRAGEADERGVGQRIAHMARIAVEEVVLAAMRLVGDDDDVTAAGEHRVAIPLLLREEFLDGGEDDAAHIDGQLRAQVRPACGLHRRLAQEILAPREGAEKLVVEVVAVGQHDHGRIGHRLLADDAPGVEGHGQTLPGALRVPDDADAPIAGIAARLSAGLVPAARLGDPLRVLLQRRRAQGLADRSLHRVELVIAGHLLDERAAVVLEDDEVAQQRQEAALLEDALDRHLQLRVEGRRQLLAVDGAPRLEPLPAGGERAEPRLHPIRHGEHGVAGEQRRQFRLVGLQLVERRPDGGVLVGRILELDHGQRQPVDEHHDVGPPRIAVLRDRELIDRRPRVGVRHIEVNHACLSAADGAVGGAVLNSHAVHQHAMEGSVARFQRRAFRPSQLPQRIVNRFVGQVVIEPA